MNIKIATGMDIKKSVIFKTSLETAFNIVLDVLCDDHSSDSSSALIEVVAAILLDRKFDIGRIECLLNEQSSKICDALIEFYLIGGISHEDRQRFCAEFAPYFALMGVGVKH